MRVTEHPLSDLLRRPKEVTDDVETGDVLLRRREEPDFLDEFSRVVTAAATVDNYEPLTQLVLEWRATAEVHADCERRPH